MARRLSTLIAQIHPQIVHAMRIPFEGMVTAAALQGGASIRDIPFLVSVWGNDFTLHAPSTPWMNRYTRFTMKNATALHTDCYRDQHLAKQWGFREGLAAVVLPGGGGVLLDVFHPPKDGVRDVNSPVVINPRGLRAYVRNDVFFKAIPLVLERFPQTRFICPGMAGESYAERWVHRLGINQNVELLPMVKHEQMASLFRQAMVAVSPSLHDGTPNTLLEAMACGCFPVVGDLESLREWIAPRVNGLLVHPLNENLLAQAIWTALEDHELREQAVQYNTRLIAESADYRRVMARAEMFYQNLIE
jgi:glycosyltransferase involved in cell wall biosynthesis